jgi:hypothetical protein
VNTVTNETSSPESFLSLDELILFTALSPDENGIMQSVSSHTVDADFTRAIEV